MLGGGYVNTVVRVDNTVRRQVHEPRAFVRELLGVLEDERWA